MPLLTSHFFEPTDESVANDAVAQAEMALAEQHPALAANLFRRALALQPDRADAIYTFGRALRDLGQAPEGGSWRRRAFLLDANALPLANYRLGIAFEASGHPAPALVCQLQALGQARDHADASAAFLRLARHGLAQSSDATLPWGDIGHMGFRLGAFDVALGAFERLAKANPHDPATWRYLGDTWFMLASFERAQQAFRLSLMLEPGDRGFWMSLGSAHYQAGAFETTHRVFVRVSRLNPYDPAATRSIGETFFQLRHFEEARNAFRRSLALAPDDPVMARYVGDACFQLGCFEEARNAFRRSLALAPDDPTVWANLGHTRYRFRRFDAAATAFARARTLDPALLEMERCLELAAFRYLNEQIKATTPSR